MRMTIILKLNEDNMKKIFVIEINDNDKKLKEEKTVNTLNQLFNNIAKDINAEKSIYIKFKRIGSTWDNILKNINTRPEKKNNTKKNGKDYLRLVN